MLSDSDSESGSGDDHQFTINEHYAKAYARKKEREELSKLKEKYGSDVDENDVGSAEEDSEDTTEDEDGEELTPAVDAAILRTLARIKRKDPGIYDVNKDVFEEEEQKTKDATFMFSRKPRDKTKPLLMRQHILNSVLETTSRSPSPTHEPTHVEEQATLRKETISAFHTAVSDGFRSENSEEEEEEEGFLVPREKTKDEVEKEMEEYKEFLQREVGEDIGELVTVGDEIESDSRKQDGSDEKGNHTGKVKERKGEKRKEKKKEKKSKSGKSKEEEDHEFLMNYILNRGWIDHSSHHVPTYSEVTTSKSKKAKEGKKGKRGDENDETSTEKANASAADEEEGEDSEDKEQSEEEGFDEDEFDEVVDTFESSYNFRFEEPGAATITTHPRLITSTVRRDENPRKAARLRKKERLAAQLLQKQEEIKRLRALQNKELKEKLERIGREGGQGVDDESLAKLAKLDVEGEWDPESYDREMRELYGDDELYQEDGDEDDNGYDGPDLEKPTWDDDIDISDILPPEVAESSLSKKKKKDKKKKGGKEDEYDDGVDIDEMDADLPSTNIDPTSSSLTPLPGINGLVGTLPTRFKYTPVLSSAYGLTAEEILLADDAELNEYVGLRTFAPYRKDKGRGWDKGRGQKLWELKKKLSGKGTGGREKGMRGEGDEGELPVKKRKGKKERMKAKMTEAVMAEADDNPDVDEGNDDNVTEETEPSSKKRKRRHKKPKEVEA